MNKLTKTVNEKANLIWSIADKLRNAYKAHEYGEVILPLTVLKRFDCILADRKSDVLKESKKLSKTFAGRDIILKQVAKHDFYNTSKFDFKRLLDDPNNIEENLNTYINAYSEEVLDIMRNFEFERHISKLARQNILYTVIEEFNTPKANLHPADVSNIEMGYIFEEIIRRFSESHNEEAGEHYTPREVVELMVNIVFSDDETLADGSKIKTVYDGACGTGGILSASLEHITSLNKSSKVFCYGQELNEQTYAICKADMLIKGQDVSKIKQGNTLSEDKFSTDKFDYIIMNPPFGGEWKNEKNAVEREAKKGIEGRFGAGTPAISDSQLLFLQNAVSKMNDNGKVAIIHNASALYSGKAGQGESEIRKYVITNDFLEAIIQLPTDMFYNTGIATYIWILNKNKKPERKGKVQLINASDFYVKMRKSLGKKRNEITPEQIKEITKIYGDFRQNENSKIYENDYFGYTTVTVIQPQLDEKGNVLKDKKGNIVIDKKLTDTENIPLLQDISEYMKKEVLPFAPNAQVDNKKTKIGYEIPFTREFYKYVKPTSTTEIKKDILQLENELDGTLKELFENE